MQHTSAAPKQFASALFLLLAASTASATAQTTIVVNEICSSNIDQWIDPSFNYGGWVELYNPTSAAVSITGWYVSDDPADLRKARIHTATSVPARGFATLWFDNYHSQYAPRMIDMKLDCDGGALYLSNATGTLQLTTTYPAAISRCSWARTADGGTTWSYCALPTPERSNAGSPFAERRLEAPVVAEPSAIGNGTTTFHVTIPEGCTLRYTTDGTTPTLTKGYNSATGIFPTSATRQYRFRLFRDGYLPSEVVTRSFLKSGYNFDLPVLSIQGTEANFYGDSLGIFTRGVNGRAGRGQSTPCNWNMDWQRPAAFEYFASDGTLLFAQEVGIERVGGWSRAWEPYSFKIRTGKQYEGRNSLAYPFFAEKPYLKHKTLQIRNGGNDTWCRVKDPFLQQIIARSGLDVDYQAYQPVAHYVNGIYKGTINMREPNNKHFVYANYGLDDEEIDQFEMSPDSGYIQKCGTYDAMRQWLNLSRTAASGETYAQICRLVDIDEFCNYMAVEFYLRNWDWPQNNVKAWRPRMENGRFRFVLFDLDGFDGTNDPFNGFANKQTYTFDRLYGQPRYNITKEIELVTLFINMLDNPTFRKKFIDTFCLVAGSVFEPVRCTAIINELANRVAPTQALDGGSPWQTANTLIASLSAARQATLIDNLRNYSKFGLTGKTAQRVTLSANINEAHLMINDMAVPTDRFEGRLFAPITVKASAPAGYRFEGWKAATTQSRTLLPASASWRYYDQGSLDGTGWKNATYNDASWASGKAPLGYYVGGSRYHNTALDYGGNPNNKRPTYYLRTSFDLAKAPEAADIFSLQYTVDDGFVIYVNGHQAGRYNMPSGTISYDTYASTYASGNPDSGTMTLSASHFVQGTNVIAIEVHNNSASSTDIYWNATLTVTSVEGSEVVCSTEEYTLPTSGNLSIRAHYVRDTEIRQPPVVINEVSAGNSVFINDLYKKNDWIELYNTTDQDIDLAGLYLSDNLSKPEKYQIAQGGGQASTILPARGHRIIWCDKLESVSQLHAPFKLSNTDGSAIRIGAPDGSWADTITYLAHDGGQSVGRYPDGGSDIYLMTIPTIEKANRLNSYSQYMASTDYSTTSIATLTTTQTEGYRIYDLRGRLVAKGEGTVRIADLPAGIYIVSSGSEKRKIVVP